MYFPEDVVFWEAYLHPVSFCEKFPIDDWMTFYPRRYINIPAIRLAEKLQMYLREICADPFSVLEDLIP